MFYIKINKWLKYYNFARFIYTLKTLYKQNKSDHSYWIDYLRKLQNLIIFFAASAFLFCNGCSNVFRQLNICYQGFSDQK